MYHLQILVLSCTSVTGGCVIEIKLMHVFFFSSKDRFLKSEKSGNIRAMLNPYTMQSKSTKKAF